MKKKDCVKILLSASVVPLAFEACTTEKDIAQDNNNSTTQINNKVKPFKKDSIQLQERLNEIANEEYKGYLSPGAMCYAVAVGKVEEHNCPICNKKIFIKDHSFNTLKNISKYVANIRSIGYDAKIICKHDNNTNNQLQNDNYDKLKQQDIKTETQTTITFKIRFSQKDKYHIVHSNIESDYSTLLAFLSGSDVCPGKNGSTISLHDNIEVIEKMTGLKYEK